jgi:hypothetical protein
MFLPLPCSWWLMFGAPLNAPTQPFNPQFSPFPAFLLTYRYSRAILSRVSRAPSPPAGYSLPDTRNLSAPHRHLLCDGPSRKPFIGNTYGTPRKCCKQKTYRKHNSFRCNTYKKLGGGRNLPTFKCGFCFPDAAAGRSNMFLASQMQSRDL